MGEGAPPNTCAVQAPLACGWAVCGPSAWSSSLINDARYTHPKARTLVAVVVAVVAAVVVAVVAAVVVAVVAAVVVAASGAALGAGSALRRRAHPVVTSGVWPSGSW